HKFTKRKCPRLFILKTTCERHFFLLRRRCSDNVFGFNLIAVLHDICQLSFVDLRMLMRFFIHKNQKVHPHTTYSTVNDKGHFPTAILDNYWYGKGCGQCTDSSTCIVNTGRKCSIFFRKKCCRSVSRCRKVSGFTYC